MPAALLAFLLLTATVDPRLAEPLRLLAEVGAPFASMLDSLNLRLTVAEMPRGAAGCYEARKRTVTVAQAVIAE